MVVCGIDASTKSTGWSIFDGKELVAYGVIKPEGQDWRERTVNQAPKLIEILNQLMLYVKLLMNLKEVY